MKIRLGIDFGGSYLSIFKKGEGLVLKIPALISVQKNNDTYKILSYGEDAKNYLKNPKEDIVTFSPIANGLVGSAEYGGCLLKFAISSIIKNYPLGLLDCTITTPYGISMDEKNKYGDICKFAGLKKINLVSGSQLVARHLQENLAGKIVMLIDIGSSKTDCTVTKNGEIITGATLGLGGKNLDIAITRHFRESDFLISEKTAEDVKLELSSLFAKDLKKFEIELINLRQEISQKKVVYSKEIYPIVKTFFGEILLLARATIFESEDSLKNQKIDYIILSGGTSLITGACEFFEKNLKIRTILSDDTNNLCASSFASLLN